MKTTTNQTATLYPKGTEFKPENLKRVKISIVFNTPKHSNQFLSFSQNERFSVTQLNKIINQLKHYDDCLFSNEDVEIVSLLVKTMNEASND